MALSLKADVSGFEQVQRVTNEITHRVSSYSPICCGLLGMGQDGCSLHCIDHDSCRCQRERNKVQCMELSTKI